MNKKGGFFLPAGSSLIVVGLGSGGERQLTLGILKCLEQAEIRFVRTMQHPVVSDLGARGIEFTSFDHIYEAHNSFPDVYEAIADKLLSEAAARPDQMIVYAVPGHPMVAERTVQILRERSCSAGVKLTLLGGESFLDQAFTQLGFDPITGFQLLNAGELNRSLLRLNLHTIIGQVYDKVTASEVKLALMDLYPDDFEIVIAQDLGTSSQKVRKLPLYELDRLEQYGDQALVYIPANKDEKLNRKSFDRLHEIVGILRSPSGCPWDQAQTHQSIRMNFIEETYEALEAIDCDDPDMMKEEFGDVLLQVLLHSQMEEDSGVFTIYDVLNTLHDKLIFRHPHVFGIEKANNVKQAVDNWTQMKQEERKLKGISKKKPILDGLPKDLPELTRSYKLQHKAASVGFERSDKQKNWAKILELVKELQETKEVEKDAEQIEKYGEFLFSAINAARFLKLDPEAALAETNRKFTEHFKFIADRMAKQNRTFDEMNLDEMNKLWDQAQKVIKQS